MYIGILIFSQPRQETFTNVERLEQAAMERGHQTIRLYEPFFSISDDSLLYQNDPIPEIDVIIARPNFIEEPSLHLYVLNAMNKRGYRVLNGKPSFVRSKNKLEQTGIFQSKNIPHPKSILTQDPSQTIEAAKKLGFPVILKIAFGTIGKGVFYVPDEMSCRPIAEYLAIRDRNPVIVQEFIKEAKRSDLRVFVIGNQVIAAMERRSSNVDVRANTSNGGQGTQVTLTKTERELALCVAREFELDIAGVDLIRSNRGPLVLEVNANPGFTELERVTGVDVAGKMIEEATSGRLL